MTLPLGTTNAYAKFGGDQASPVFSFDFQMYILHIYILYLQRISLFTIVGCIIIQDPNKVSNSLKYIVLTTDKLVSVTI